MLKGKDGVVKLGPAGNEEAIGHIQSWALDEQADQISGWGMGDEYETSFTSIKRFSGNVVVYYAPGDPSADLRPGDEISLELYPGGETSGSAYFSGNVCVTGLPTEGAKDGIPGLTINFAGRGALSRGTVA